MEKVIVLLSGGIDSSVAVAFLKLAGFDVCPLFINHHQGPLEAEREATATITSTLGLSEPLEVEVDRILGEGFDPNQIVRPNAITVINLSGTETSAERILVAAILRRIFAKRKLGVLPKFICVVEEIHRYAPAETSTVAKGAVATIVKEGRKFGAGLVAVSQSPKDLDPNILKLCNTRIILRLDNPLDLAAIRPYVGTLPEELLETLPFFPAGRSILSGLMSRVPAIVDIRLRRTKHSGGTGEAKTREIEYSTVESRSIAPRDEVVTKKSLSSLEQSTLSEYSR